MDINLVKLEEEEEDIYNVNNHLDNSNTVDSLSVFCESGLLSKDLTCQESITEVNSENLTFGSENYESDRDVSGKKKIHFSGTDVCQDPAKFLQSHLDRLNCINLKKMGDADSKNHKFECPESQCNYSSNELYKLKNHLKIVHLKIKPFKCVECDYEASRKSQLRNHIDSVHSSGKKYECIQCGYSTNVKCSLQKHISCVHLKEKKFKCLLCDFASGEKGDLKKHTEGVHLRMKLFECPQCNIKMYRKIDRDRHVASVHLKEKHFKCSECEFSSSTRHGLNIHMNGIHLKVKFECKECSFTTAFRKGLKRHVDCVHLKLKPYACLQCDFKASRKENLDSHRKIHLRENS